VKAHLEKPEGKVREVVFVLFGRQAYEAHEGVL